MNNNLKNILLVSALLGSGEYSGMEIILDKDVSECINYMYFWMLSYFGKNGRKQGEYYKKFKEKYDSLNEAQQQRVIVEYNSIIQSQKENTQNNEEESQTRG